MKESKYIVLNFLHHSSATEKNLILQTSKFRNLTQTRKHLYLYYNISSANINVKDFPKICFSSGVEK